MNKRVQKILRKDIWTDSDLRAVIAEHERLSNMPVSKRSTEDSMGLYCLRSELRSYTSAKRTIEKSLLKKPNFKRKPKMKI